MHLPSFIRIFGVMFVLLPYPVWAESPSPDKAYRFETVERLDASERAADRFEHAFDDHVEFRDGNLYRNGRPFFLVGSEIGAGQWGQKLMFLPRVMGDNYVTIGASPTRHFYQYLDNQQLVLAWERVPFVKSMANEAARNRLFVYLDMGTGVARNMASVVHGLGEYKRPVRPGLAGSVQRILWPLLSHRRQLQAGSTVLPERFRVLFAVLRAEG